MKQGKGLVHYSWANRSNESPTKESCGSESLSLSLSLAVGELHQ